MKPISVWGWLGGYDGQWPIGKFGQDAGVTPLEFLMITESQDLGLMSHSKDGAFVFTVYCPSHYTGMLGPTQNTGWAPPAGLTNTSSSSNLV